jgi:hypothetical protein
MVHKQRLKLRNVPLRVQIIVWTASKDEGSPDLSSLRLLKVVRMLKLLRAVRLMVFLEKVQAREGFQTLKKAIQVN